MSFATFFGFLAGIVCVLLGMYGLKDTYTFPLSIYVIANRTLIGFVIGISSLSMNWVIHGALIGFMVSIPFALGILLEPDKTQVMIASLVLGIIYGVIIEFFTTAVFNKKSTKQA